MAMLHPHVIRWLLILFLSLLCLPLASTPALAGATLHANVVYDFCSDRSRMIQISVVVVAIGCALMWWYR